MNYELIATSVVSALGGGGATALINSRLAKRKLDGEQKLAEEQQPVDQLKDAFDTVNKTYQKLLEVSEARRTDESQVLGKRIDKLETDIANCLQGHVTDAEERGFMKGRMDEMSRQIGLNTSATAAAKDTAIVANTKADAAMDASQTALVNLPPPGSLEQVDNRKTSA